MTMRLLRDRIPGVGHRYIQFAPEQLVEELQKHSPLSQVDKTLRGGRSGVIMIRMGRKRHSPLLAETKEPPAELPHEANIAYGGDGGGLNSPSKRSCPELTTSLVILLISSDRPLDDRVQPDQPINLS